MRKAPTQARRQYWHRRTLKALTGAGALLAGAAAAIRLLWPLF